MVSFRLATALATAGVLAASSAEAQSYQRLSQTRALHGELDVAVKVRFGMGNFRLVPARDGELYRINLVYDDERFDAVANYDPGTRMLEAGVSTRRRATRYRRNTQQRLDLEVATGVPTALALEFGAGAAQMELGGLSIVEASIQTGASETRISFDQANPADCRTLNIEVGASEFHATGLGNARCREVSIKAGAGDVHLDFSGEWQGGFQSNVRATVGVGAMRLRIPDGVGVQLRVTRFLASVDRPGFVRRGDNFYSLNWDASEARMIVDVSAALGAFEIEWAGR